MIRRTDIGFSKEVYLGNYYKDMKLLNFLKKAIDSGEEIHNDESPATKVHEAKHNGDPDFQFVSFENIIRYLSADIRDRMFNLKYLNGLILGASKTGSFLLTEKGEKFLEDYLKSKNS